MPTNSNELSLNKIWESIVRFFFAPASPLPLACLRISLAGMLLFQAWLISGDLYELYGSSGIMQEALARALVDHSVPRLSWILPIMAKVGFSEYNVILGAAVFYILSLFALLFGVFTRFAAFSSWLLHWTFMNTGYHTNYGADTYSHIFLFYLIWMPSGLVLSIDSLNESAKQGSGDLVRLSLRVIQIHLCISYFFSGLEKVVGPQWQNGEVIWRALTLPVYQQLEMSWLASYPWIAKTLSWGTLVVEFGYTIFIWPKATRKLWILLVVSLHIGIALFLGLHIFGLLMACFSLCVFGVSADLGTESASNFIRSARRNIEKGVSPSKWVSSKSNVAME